MPRSLVESQKRHSVDPRDHCGASRAVEMIHASATVHSTLIATPQAVHPRADSLKS